jgi:hypothetical protein
MVKGSTQEASLTSVRDYEGRPFPTQEDQKNFIRDHFAKSFKKPENEPENLEGCIERFLGEDILAHPLVRNMKLNEEERNILENDLSLEELDNALDGANSNSAAGIDGINTRFIKQFWFIFREPLQRYAMTCFQKKQLTPSFKTAVIKLIPKKGNAADIKKMAPDFIAELHVQNYF